MACLFRLRNAPLQRIVYKIPDAQIRLIAKELNETESSEDARRITFTK